jgi:hypothetical protein
LSPRKYNTISVCSESLANPTYKLCEWNMLLDHTTKDEHGWWSTMGKVYFYVNITKYIMNFVLYRNWGCNSSRYECFHLLGYSAV